MTLPLDLTGRVFGRLTVNAREENDRFGKTRWRCLCTCGKETTTRANTLLKGETRSCGCLHAESVKVSKRTHGYARTPVYRVWSVMKARCQNPTDPNYKNYGGRGITVCQRWQADFDNFRMDMGPRPPKLTLERKDNNGPYSPENCVWASRAEQGRNRRVNVRIVYGGEALTLGEWAARTGLPESLLYFRIRTSGWTAEEALTTPSQRKKPWPKQDS